MRLGTKCVQHLRVPVSQWDNVRRRHFTRMDSFARGTMAAVLSQVFTEVVQQKSRSAAVMIDQAQYLVQPFDVPAFARGEAPDHRFGDAGTIDVAALEAIALSRAGHLKRQRALLFQIVDRRHEALAALACRRRTFTEPRPS